MRRFILLILAFAMLLPSIADAYDMLVLQSSHNQIYEEVLKGCRTGRTVSQRVIVLSDYAEVDIMRIVREDRPRLILAVGDAALTAARKVRQIPVVSVMALGIHALYGSQPNLTGIGMFASPELYLSVFQRIKARRVGVVHNPAKSGWYLHLAQQAAQQAGIELVVKQVATPRDTITQLSSLAGQVDALWMLPDTTAVTRETIEGYFRFSQNQRIPVISFAEPYLKLGAAAVTNIDETELGRQAADMAARLLGGSALADLPLKFPHGISLKTNPGVLSRLRIDLKN